MSTTVFIVNNGGAIMAPNHVRTLLVAGSKFVIGGDKDSHGPQEFGFEKRHVEHHLASGYLSILSGSGLDEGMIRSDIMIENMPGVVHHAPISHKDDESARVITSDAEGNQMISGGRDTAPGPGVTTVDSASQLGRDANVNKNDAGQAKSLWGFDPDALRGHDLDQMNVMILERDNSVAPFETAEEARTWLSQDWRAPVITPSQAVRAAQG